MGCGGSKPAEPLPPPPQPESRPLDNYSLEAINAKIAAKAAEAAAAGPSAAPKQPQEFKRRFNQQHRASRRGLGRHKINRAGGVGSENNMSALVRNSEMEQVKSRMAAKAAARAAEMARSVTRRSRASHADGEADGGRFRENGPIHALAFVARLKGRVAHAASGVAHTLHLDHAHHHRESTAGARQSMAAHHPHAASFVSRLKSRLHLSHKNVASAPEAAPEAATAGAGDASEAEATTAQSDPPVVPAGEGAPGTAVAAPAAAQPTPTVEC
jgi:hypothetical protein